ncbi:hypothetical protein EVAR_60979_1 [Eumeta japonica]|uniref:Uncharacterized protein n=1 Tax=Eumeta variegata TaxID=151549 RepID=A0A4C1XVA4_EUMVA|nr:hypothetical protein EVAR_60979_1 [Eumeta japonica]
MINTSEAPLAHAHWHAGRRRPHTDTPSAALRSPVDLGLRGADRTDRSNTIMDGAKLEIAERAIFERPHEHIISLEGVDCAATLRNVRYVGARVGRPPAPRPPPAARGRSSRAPAFPSQSSRGRRAGADFA